MNKTLFALTAAGMLALAAPASAQMVELTPEVRTGFYGYIESEAVPSTQLPEGFEDSAPLPADIELYEMPEVVVTAQPAYADYRYMHSGERIYIIEPDTRNVVTVIER